MWIKLWIQDRTSVSVRRQVNKLAYVLAQYVNDVANFVTWIEENLNMIEPHWLKMYWISLFLNESYIFLKKEEDKAVDTYFLLCSCNKKYHPCEYFMRGITWHVKHLQKIFLFVGLIQIEEGTEGVKKKLCFIFFIMYSNNYNYNNWYLDSELAQMFSNCNLWRSFNIGEYKRQSQIHRHDTRRWPTY